MTEALFWRDREVPIRYSKRKTVALHVKAGEIELRAPMHTENAFLQQFLDSRSDWLERALREQNSKARDRIDYSRANRIPFMGFDVQIRRELSSHSATWSLTPDGLTLHLNDPENADATMALITGFYKAQARFWLPKKTREQVDKAGLTPKLTDIRLRKTKTKWGHCTREGRIQYNWLIMMAPEPVIDYLVCHEVSHLRHLNHSPAFWAQVESLHPNFRQDRQWLRDNEHRLTLED